MQNRVIPESELVLNPDGSVYHLHLKNQHIADHVLLVGDPGRVTQVSQFFDSIEFKTANREFVTVTGSYQGTRFTALSTGIGTDNIDIVLNELDAAINIDPATRMARPQKRSLNIIRIGTSGSLQADIPVDECVISSYALGLDGLIYYYKFEMSDIEKDITNQLNKILNWDEQLSTPYIVAADQSLLDVLGDSMIAGITVTATGFYGPQGRTLNLELSNKKMHQQFQEFNYQGLKITNFEMETSAIYALGKLLGHRCCTCCAIIANRATMEYSKNYTPVIDGLIEQVLGKLSA